MEPGFFINIVLPWLVSRLKAPTYWCPHWGFCKNSPYERRRSVFAKSPVRTSSYAIIGQIDEKSGLDRGNADLCVGPGGDLVECRRHPGFGLLF